MTRAASLPSSSESTPPIRSPKVSELLARQIVEQIIGQGLPEGTALLPEKAMMEKYGLGRSTVREAMRLLETRGVIDIRQGIQGGPVVRTPRPSDLSGSMSLVLAFNGATLADLVTARYSLEPVCVRLAADTITAEDIAELRDTVAKMKANINDQAEFRRQSERFHAVVVSAAANPVMLTMLMSIRGISDSMTERIDYTVRRRNVIMRAHARIIDALEAHDVDEAQAQMSEHLDEACRFWKKSYGALYSQKVTWRL
jgi:GntR family transcriptional regulator, transcriptional repressor for pyruvate dehydrogenase complex